MSLILKGIDLPSKPTQIKIYPNGIIFCANEDGIYVPKYQAIQIPNPHGDIIDRNQVFTYSHRDVQNLEEVPVILEAEHE